MNFKIYGSDLYKALSIVYGTNGARGVRPILDHVLLEANKKQERLSVYSTDGNIHVVATAPLLYATDNGKVFIPFLREHLSCGYT